MPLMPFGSKLRTVLSMKTTHARFHLSSAFCLARTICHYVWFMSHRGDICIILHRRALPAAMVFHFLRSKRNLKQHFGLTKGPSRQLPVSPLRKNNSNHLVIPCSLQNIPARQYQVALLDADFVCVRAASYERVPSTQFMIQKPYGQTCNANEAEYG